MKYFKILFIFLFTLVHFVGTSQLLKRYKTFSYSVNEGLLQSTVTDLEIDKNNFCWISFPNGIQKFDGHNFLSVPVQPGLPDDKNVYFFKCKSGDLLIGHSKGISKYDISKNDFDLIYRHPASNMNSPLFLGENDGIIYFTFLTGSLIELNSQTFKKIAETALPFNNDVLGTGAFLKASGNIIDHRIVFQQNNFLYLWDLKNRKLLYESNEIPFLSSVFLKMKSINEVLHYKQENNYLYIYNFSTGITSRNLSIGFKDNFITRTKSFTWHGQELVSYDKNLFETDNDMLELKTQLVNFQNQPIGGSGIAIIKEDNFGNLWISTILDGIKKIINNNYQIKYYGGVGSTSNFAMSIFPDKNNNRIILGTSKHGLLIFDTSQRLIKNIIGIPGSNFPLAVNQIVKNKRQDYFLFISGSKFIVKLSSNLKRITTIPIIAPSSKEVFGVNYFANLLFQNEQEVVIQSQGSIYRFNFLQDHVTEYVITTQYTHGGILYNDRILTHYNEELVYLDTSTFKVVQKIALKGTGGVRSFAKSNDGQIYLGTNKGVYKINESGKILEQYNRSTGLPDECIYTIALDKDNNIWCSTNKGIIKINKNKSFLQITREDGLQENEFNTNAIAISDNGEYFYGGVNGGSSFYPSTINPEEQKLQLLVTNLEVNNKQEFTDTAVWNISRISLPHNKNLLSFDFIAMGNNNPGQYIYQYKMKGIDDRWIQNKDLQTVRYFLPPGKYIFQMYASRYFKNNARPLKEIEIIITPPFWKTWWFLSMLTLISLAIITYIIDSNIRHTYRKKVRLLEDEKNIQIERERISRDLHDNIGGYANAVLYKSELLENKQNHLAHDQIITDLRFASKEIITSLRETIWALKKTNYSAKDCLIRVRNFIQPFNNYYPSIQFKIQGDASEEKNLSHSTALHIVRIVQEAVSNAIKHASPANIIITSEEENGHWILSVQDDGKGFDEHSIIDVEIGNGLANMRKRVEEAGLTLKINSTPGQGTIIILII